MPSITATLQPDNVPPRVLLEVDLSDQSPVPTSVTLHRQDFTGLNPVRAAEPATLSGGTWVGYDYELPFGVPVQYRVALASGTIVWSATVTLNVAGLWLRHVSIPARSVSFTRDQVAAGSHAEIQRSTRRAVLQPIGRSTPIVVTSGARSSAEFTLTLLTHDDVTSSQLNDLLSDESPLLLGVPPSMGLRLGQDYVSVGDLSVRRSGYGADLTWSLPCLVVDRPVGGIVSQRTYNDLLEFATYDELPLVYATYNDMLADIRRDNVDDAGNPPPSDGGFGTGAFGTSPFGGG
jgi:hypothetical protein